MPKATVITATRHRVSQVASRLAGQFVAPEASARIEKLLKQKFAINEQLKELSEQKDVLNDKLLRGVDAEGEADADGKVRLQSETHNLQIVEAVNKVIDEKLLRAAFIHFKLKLDPDVFDGLIEMATKLTPYRYVLPTPKGKDKEATARRRESFGRVMGIAKKAKP